MDDDSSEDELDEMEEEFPDMGSFCAKKIRSWTPEEDRFGPAMNDLVWSFFTL